MVRLVSVVALVFGLIVSSSLVVTAQIKDAASGVGEEDIAAIAESVLEADPNNLLEGLETPPDDRDLPDGFFNPPSGVPANADVIEAFAVPIDDLDGAIGSVSHGFDTDGAVIEGLLSAGIINFIVVDAEFTDRDLDEFEEGAAAGVDDGEPGLAGSVDRIEISGAEAVLIMVELEEAGIFGAVQVIAVPVGNTLLLGTVVVADTGEVDPDVVLEHAEALVVAGAVYLGEVAEDAS